MTETVPLDIFICFVIFLYILINKSCMYDHLVPGMGLMILDKNQTMIDIILP